MFDRIDDGASGPGPWPEEHWWTIEVLDGTFSADVWRDSHMASLVEAAITNGALDWHWQRHSWGVLFEVALRDDAQWEVFRHLPAVVAALDAVPDPIHGLLTYPGRGGSSATADPRRPRPRAGAGAAELPREPAPNLVARLTAIA